MAQNSWPFENIDTSETQYSQLFSEFQDNGVAGNPATVGALAVGTSTGLGLTVAAGFAIVRGFAYENTSTVNLTPDPASSQPRIDTVVLRLDPTANTITAALKKGTPGASPAQPALTQTPGGIWEMPLADFYILAEATSLGPEQLVDRRQFLGATVGLWSSNSRPASPDLGRIGYNVTISKFEWWNGSAWSAALPFDLTIADGTITNAMLAGSIGDDKLVTPPGRYRSVATNGASSFTVSNNERGRLVVTSNGTSVTITVNTGLVAGDRIDFIQEGAGQITFAAGAGVTLQSNGGRLKTKGQYSAATVVAIGDNNLRLIGDLVA